MHLCWRRRPCLPQLPCGNSGANDGSSITVCASLAALSSAAILQLATLPASGAHTHVSKEVAVNLTTPERPRRKPDRLLEKWRPLPRTAVETAASIGAEVFAVDLGLASSNRGGQILPEASALLRSVLRERRVVKVPGTVLDGAPAFERICRVFGDSLQPVNARGNSVQLYIVQNRDSAAEPKRPSDSWHSDLSYLTRPASATVLYAIEVPEDVDGETQGDTLFVDMVAAYAALPLSMQQRLSRMQGLHQHPSTPDSQNPRLQQGQSHVTTHPMVVNTQAYRGNHANVKRALFVNPAYTVDIRNEDGTEIADSKQLLQKLVVHCLQPQFMLRLRWQVGALVVWDNSALWHRATTLEMASSAHKQRRVMFRASVLCDSPL